jgi:heme/copper-type cytochrome/quinol oxidase subunit 4
MLKQLLSLYKISLILSVALAILLISFTVETRPLQIAVIVLGSLLGSIVLDLDYFLHAYLLEPDADFSLNLKAYVFTTISKAHYLI